MGESGRAYWRQYPITFRRDRKILRTSVNIDGAVTEMRTEHFPNTSCVYCLFPTHQYDISLYCQVIFFQEYIRITVPVYLLIICSLKMSNTVFTNGNNFVRTPHEVDTITSKHSLH